MLVSKDVIVFTQSNHTVFDGVHVANLFSFLFCMFFGVTSMSVFLLCLVCPMVPVSLDYHFLIAPPVFSNVLITFLQTKFRIILIKKD